MVAVDALLQIWAMSGTAMKATTGKKTALSYRGLS